MEDCYNIIRWWGIRFRWKKTIKRKRNKDNNGSNENNKHCHRHNLISSHLISNWPLSYLWSLLSPSRWSIIQKSVWSISSSSPWGLAIIRWRCVFSHRGSVHTSSLHKIFCKFTIGNSYLETPYHPDRENQTHLFLLWSLKITSLTQNHHQWRRERRFSVLWLERSSQAQLFWPTLTTTTTTMMHCTKHKSVTAPPVTKTTTVQCKAREHNTM